MQINWFTVIAQIINFLILVWLLKRFLYKPILKAIDEREKLISSQLKDAEFKKAEANKEREDYQKKNQDFDQQSAVQMNNAKTQANAERQKILEEARGESNILRSNLEKAQKDDEQRMSQEIMRKAHQEVFAITKKTLADLASTSLEDQTVSVFIRRIAGLTEVEKKQFVTAFDSPGRPILIQTAFELPAPQRSEIESAVRKLIEPKAGFEYGTESGLISGIEMNANGYKLAWSVSDYLSSMKNIFIENPGLEKGEKENVAG